MDRPTFEAEAEGTAYAVLSYFGVDVSEYSFAYLARWAGSKEVVKAALSNIQKAVQSLIEAVEAHSLVPDAAPTRQPCDEPQDAPVFCSANSSVSG